LGPGVFALAYLNYTLNEGDIINYTTVAFDGFIDTSTYNYDYVVFGEGNYLASDSPIVVNSTNSVNSVFCDDNYCYTADNFSSFGKYFKNGTVVLGKNGTKGGVVKPIAVSTNATDIFCDVNYCYMFHNGGDFTKVFKNGTVAIGDGGTEGEEINPYNAGGNPNDLYCDRDYCYGAHGSSTGAKFTKVTKNRGIVIGDGGSFSEEVNVDPNNMTGIFCEEENGFCFGSHLGGNFTKFYKNGTIIFGTWD